MSIPHAVVRKNMLFGWVRLYVRSESLAELDRAPIHQQNHQLVRDGTLLRARVRGVTRPAESTHEDLGREKGWCVMVCD